MDFSKLKGVSGVRDHEQSDPDARVTGILKVSEGGYLPSTVQLRTKVSPTIYTVEFALGDLKAIENDPRVVSVKVSEKLPLQKLPSVPSR